MPNELFIVGAVAFGFVAVMSIFGVIIAKADANKEKVSDWSIALFCATAFCIICIIGIVNTRVLCQNCEAVVTTRYCKQCGEYTGINNGECISCGEYTDTEYCGNCGAHQKPKESQKEDESNSSSSDNKNKEDSSSSKDKKPSAIN